MYRAICDVCSCECSVNSLREICKRFNIWTRHLWKKFTSRPCISIATNIRRVMGVGWKGWKVVSYFLTSREAKVRYISDACKNREMLVGGKF